MKFRIIAVDYLSKYDSDFVWKNLHPKNKPYYVVQYKKDPSFFGLIKHDWKSVYYNAEELAKRAYFNDISFEPVSMMYDGKDILVPNMQFAKNLLSITKKHFGVDPVASKYHVVFQEEDDRACDSNTLVTKYDDLINED